MSDMRVDEAVAVVANRAIANALRSEFVDNPQDWWERFEEIGEHDWNKIVEQIERIAAGFDPNKESFDAAYDYLGARADAS